MLYYIMVNNYKNDKEPLSDEYIYGEGVYDTMKDMYNNVKNYTDTVLHGRNDYPPKVRNLIKIHGDKRITHITIDRTPVPSVLTSALNAVSFGAFKERFDKLPYDKLFHLRMDLTLADNTHLAVEKNEVINMYLNPKKKKGGEQIDVIFRETDLTLNKLLAGGQSIQKDKWFGYSANNNNCQDFILALMNGSRIGNEQDKQFVKQDTSTLFKGDSFLRKFSNTVTDIGAKVNEITTGTGMMIYKNKLSNNKYMNKHYSSDSDSSSDEGYDSPPSRGCGLHNENKIINKINKLTNMLHKHQQVHGGKLNFINPLKQLIHTVKKGHSPSGTGDLVHIDINSHNAKGDISGDGISGGNVALRQLLENYKKREDDDLKKNMKQFYKDRNDEIAALGKKVKALPKYGKRVGSGFKKGSQEAKDHMARIRALRRK